MTLQSQKSQRSAFAEYWSVDNPQRDLILVVALFLLSMLVRLLRLMDQDVWFDEAAILFQIQKSFGQIWDFCKTENFPPFYSWLLKLWSYPSTNIYWLRLLDVLIGATVPPIAYYWGKSLLDRRLGMALGLMCALALPLIYYSQVIRMYSLFLFFASVSYLAFQLALETNKYRYWLVVAISNLLGFYTFLFMLFIIAAEILVLLTKFKLKWSLYKRALITHLPVLALMLFWVVPFLDRYTYLQTPTELHHITGNNLVAFALFLGTGTDFQNNYLLALILNVPMLIGFVLSVPLWFKTDKIYTPAILFWSSLLLTIIISLIGQTIFFNRYLLFLVPIYFALAAVGWLNLRKKVLRWVGICTLFLSLVISFTYYNLYYLEVHDDFRYLWFRVERTDGHSFSKMSQFLQEKIHPGEVIIHYSNIPIRHFTYFPFLYYHNRQLPEYIYSKSELPQNSGQQYLNPGERISNFEQLQPKPQGVWLVTLQSMQGLTDPKFYLEGDKPAWIHVENLPKELYLAGFQLQQSFRIGGVSAIHYLSVDLN